MRFLLVRVQGGAGLPGTTRGLALCGTNSTIRGLSIGGFQAGSLAGGTRVDGTDCPSPASGHTFAGNFIGLAVDGNTDIGSGIGVNLLSLANSVVGGNTLADRNVISGWSSGINISNSSTGIQVLNNMFGTNAADTLSVPNIGGVSLGAAVTNNTIGTATAPNLFASNGRGISTGTTGNNNHWTGNLFRVNTPGMAVDLHGNSGVNLNDTNDNDSGFNGLQNFPVITNATATGTDLIVTGTLDVGNASDLAYELSIHATDRCDETGHGEGEIFLGVETRNLRTTSEAFTLTVPYTGPNGGRRAITMLARHPTNGSSEFSQCFLFESGSPLVVNSTNDIADGICNAAHCSLRDALLQANGQPERDEITFAIPGDGPHRITPLSAYPAIIETVTVDAYSQSGAAVNTHPTESNATLRIILDLSLSSQAGFTVAGAGSRFRGLSVVNADAVGSSVFTANTGIDLHGNWFGVEPDGTTATPMLRSALTIAGSPTSVGSNDIADRNVFAGFTSSTVISVGDLNTTNLLIEGNLFGLLPDGVTAARNNTSASTLAGNNNPMIVRNNTFGCSGLHLNAFGTLVESNRFGLASDGQTIPTGVCNAGRIQPRSNARFVTNRIAAPGNGGKGIELGTNTVGVVLDRNTIFDAHDRNRPRQ
ncbi:MAG: CSLREA domain-containing protein [Ahniella sp.]|nr:CSLREA domain-containing protein [Ahniella sp.]